MGAYLSDLYVDKPSQSSSRILTFHSTAKWDAHFEASRDIDKLMVIEFVASWCGPCKDTEPIIRDFAAKYTDVEFIKLDVDEFKDMAQQFQVQAMPTFILIKTGEFLGKLIGARKEELQQLIENYRDLDLRSIIGA